MSTHSKKNQAQKKNVAQKVEADENAEMVYAISVNIVPPNGCKFEVQGSRKYEKYSNAKKNERMEILKKGVKSFNSAPNFDEDMMRNAHQMMIEKIQEDEELFGFYDYEENIVNVKKSTFALMAEKIFQIIKSRRETQPGKWPKKTKTSVNSFNKYLKSVEFAKFLDGITYSAPQSRLRVMKNISFNIFNQIPVFSDLEGGKKQECTIPESLSYYYGDRNLAYAGKNEELKKAALLSSQEQNKIVCNCCSSDPIVKCSENKNCPCYQTNLKFQQIRDKIWKSEKNPMRAEPTKINSFDPILFAPQDGVFFENMAFACCEDCGCKGKCTNNPLLLVEKNVFPLEVFRENEIIGFGVRTYATIPAGTPVMEFAGEIVDEKNFNPDNIDYAYQLMETKEREPVVWQTLLDCHPWTKEYKKLLKSFSKQRFFVDPKHYGNVGRTASHSCTPNTELIRVFQRSVSPLNARLVFVSLENIYPGTPLTLDYGANYVQEQFGNNCLCSSFACLRHTNSPSSHFDKNQLAKCFEEAAKHQHRKYEELIEQKENRKRARSNDLDDVEPRLKRKNKYN